MAFVQKSAKEIISKSEGDTSNLQSDLIELNSAWDRVCKLSVSKQERLEQAHKLVGYFVNMENVCVEPGTDSVLTGRKILGLLS